jgi:hypothetical protein
MIMAADAPAAASVELLEQALQAEGLRLRGVCAVVTGDALPPLPGGGPSAALALVGIAGSSFWSRFKASPEYRDGGPDPLDRWSQRIGQSLAARFDGVALFPFQGPPYLPFQQWALRCEPLQRSPLGLLIHPEFGLWHAFRFALALAEQPMGLPAAHGGQGRAAQPAGVDSSICSRCDGQPCLSTCPVQAFTGSSYRVDDCADWLRQPSGQDCMARGCQARRACPVGSAWRYEDEHAAFHMAAFLGKRP